MELQGVGIGYRRELAHALLARPEAVDFVEVVAEACRDPAQRREALALAEVWPVVPHGVKLSLGSAEGIDVGRARELGRLARELRAPLVSEHVSFVRTIASDSYIIVSVFGSCANTCQPTIFRLRMSCHAVSHGRHGRPSCVTITSHW